MHRPLLALLWLSACSDWELPAAPAHPPRQVVVEPLGDVSAAPAVLRLRVVGAAGRSALADFRLFEGELSSYYLRRLAARDVPDTLVEREIGAVVWAEGADVVVAPARALPAGVLSLATPELGLVAAITVDPGLVPWLARRWPPPGEPSGSGLSVFCGDAAARIAEGSFVLAPAESMAKLSAGLDEQALLADECVRLESTETGTPGAPALPPPLAGEVALEPLPMIEGEQRSTAPSCEAGELTLGPACALVDDDRLVLRAPSEPSLWAMALPAPLLGVAAPGASLVVRGLEPDRAVRLRATAFDHAGVRTEIDTLLTGAARHAHVVINEVLANPRGPESQSEWLELVNDGAESVGLAGFELGDAGGSVPLPVADLAPGEIVLLARAGFAPDPELDVAPPPGTRVLALPSLGQAGLANAGELLRLYDADGRVLSRVPALAAPDVGVSLARRSPDAPDEQASFGPHAAPGASPGAPNELAPTP